jgi:hypothetical protein
MGYTHGVKWTEESIIDGILGVKNTLGIEYMPSKKEMASVTGNKKLSCAMTKHGGHIYFRDLLGLEEKESCSKLGDENEMYVMDLLKEKGYKPRKTPPRHPYDILVNDIVKIDVKSSNVIPSRVKGINEFTFSINNEFPKCDLFVFITILGDNRDLYIIPSKYIMQSQLAVCETSKYQKYKNRFDYIESYLKLHNKINN